MSTTNKTGDKAKKRRFKGKTGTRTTAANDGIKVLDDTAVTLSTNLEQSKLAMAANKQAIAEQNEPTPEQVEERLVDMTEEAVDISSALHAERVQMEEEHEELITMMDNLPTADEMVESVIQKSDLPKEKPAKAKKEKGVKKLERKRAVVETAPEYTEEERIEFIKSLGLEPVSDELEPAKKKKKKKDKKKKKKKNKHTVAVESTKVEYSFNRKKTPNVVVRGINAVANGILGVVASPLLLLPDDWYFLQTPKNKKVKKNKWAK